MAAGPDLPLTVNAPNTTVAPLASGQLLLVGAGINSFGFFSSRTTVLFDPTTQIFTQAGDAEEGPNFLPTITPLLDGTALMAEGARGLQPFASAERFDPGNNSWLPAGSMSVARLAHSATHLHDGRVLIAGGLACCVRTQDTISQFFADTAEIYDPETDSFTATGSIATSRPLHTATLLDDGRVLIAGGVGGDPQAPVNTEIYDPATGLFSPAGDLHVARANAAATALTDGRVLLTGGVAPDGNFSVGIQVTELFVPGLGWVLGPPLQPSWTDSTTTLLGNGKVLIFGGQ